MRVFWTEAAIKQLEAIRDYLAQTSPEYARKVAGRLVKRSEQIEVPAVIHTSRRELPQDE